MATSSAQRACSWPRTSASSVASAKRVASPAAGRMGVSPAILTAGRRRAAAAFRPRGPATRRATSSRPSTPTTSMPRDEPGLGQVRARQATRRCPASRKVETIGNTPGTGLTLPSRDSSPSRAHAPPAVRIWPARDQDADGDGDVVGGATLAPVRRREVHRDATERVVEAGVAQRAPDPFTRLGQRGVGEAHDLAAGQPRGDVHLHADELTVEAADDGGIEDREHAPECGLGCLAWTLPRLASG